MRALIQNTFLLCLAALCFIGKADAFIGTANSPTFVSSQIAWNQGAPDWSAWDGTLDGPTQYFYDDGDNHGPTHLTATGKAEFVAIHRHYTTPQSRKIGVYSITDKVISEDAVSDISGIVGTEGIFPSMPRVNMSDDRVLSGIFGSGGSFIVLHSKSGTTLAQLDLDDFTSLSTIDRNYRSIERLSATKAVLFYSEASGVSYKSVIIDISGDTISFGAPVATGGSTTVSRYGALSVIDESNFIVAYDTTAYLYSVSGLTITLEHSIDVRSDGNPMLDVNGSAIVRDGMFAVVYEYGATNQLQLIDFDTGAGTLTRGQSLQITATGSFDGPQEHGITKASDGVLLAAICPSSVLGTDLYRINVAEDGTPTSSGVIYNVVGDHPTLRMMKNSTAAVLTTQYTDAASDNIIVMKTLYPNGINYTALEIALLGDSITNQNDKWTNVQDTKEANGFITNLNYKTFGRYEYSKFRNYGVSGDETAEILDRLTEIEGTPDLVFVMAGTNDVGSQVATSTITSNLDTIYTYITDTLGAKVVALPILPRSYWGSFNASEITQGKADINTVNAWIESQASDDIIVIDTLYNAFEGSTADEPATDLTYDGLHPSWQGAYVIQTEARKKLDSEYGTYEQDAYWKSGTNLLSTEDTSGTGGTKGSGVSGDVATGYDADRIGTDDDSFRTLSKTANDYQRIIIDVDSGNASEEGLYFQTATLTPDVAGQYYVEAVVNVQDVTNIENISLDVREEGTTLSNIYNVGMNDKDGSTAPVIGRGLLKTPVFTIRDDTSKVLRPRIIISGDASSQDIYADVIVESIRVVKTGDVDYLDTLFPGTDFEIDISQFDSYDGSAQLIDSLTNSVQFYLGADSSADSTDPTYDELGSLESDGNSRISITSNTTLSDNMHDSGETTLEYTVAAKVYIPDNFTSGLTILWGTANSSADDGVRFDYDASDQRFEFRQANGLTYASNNIGSGIELAGGWHTIIFGVQKTGATSGNWFLKLNDDSEISGSFSNWNTTTQPASDNFQFSGVDGSYELPDGAKFRAGTLIDDYISGTDAEDLKALWDERHN